MATTVSINDESPAELHDGPETLRSRRSGTPRTSGAEPCEALTRIVIEALRALGQAGAPERANRLAGQAWSALRDPHPELAQRINALMHGLAKMPSDPSRDHPNPTAAKEPRDVRHRA